MPVSGGSPSGCPRVVGMPFWMSDSGRETLPNVQERSKGPPAYPGVVAGP